MDQDAAVKLTKYFGAGVIASIWCYAGAGNWSIQVAREGRALFYGIDALRRSVWGMSQRSTPDWQLWGEKAESPILLHTLEDACYCVHELVAAVAYVRQMSTEECWQDVPGNVFQLLTARELGSAPVGKNLSGE